MNPEQRKQRIETGVKLFAVLAVSFIVAPFVFIAIKGLIGLTVAAAVAIGTIQLTPLAAMKFANWGNYEPGNVRWATKLVQNNNKRCNKCIEFRGETKTLSDWSRTIGVGIFTLASRFNKLEWDTERALTTKARVMRRVQK